MATDRITRRGSTQTPVTGAVSFRGDPRPGMDRSPFRRRLALEQIIAIAAWVLVVVNVQPWVKEISGPQGQTIVESNTNKGLLMAAVFMLAATLAAPSFRARMPATYLLYFGYLFVAAATALRLSEPVTPLLRIGRFGLAITIPLLLWRWLGGWPALFLNTHRVAHVLLGLVVVVGLAAAPSAAWTEEGYVGGGGRLQGVFLPMHPTRVGEIGAILVGLALTALVFRRMQHLPGIILASLGLSLIILSRTRTAATALLIALFAAFCLTRRYRLGRRALRTILLLVLLAIPLLVPIRSWALRGQDTDEFSSFTGRTRAWSAVIEQQSSLSSVMFGHGLGNKRVLLRRGEGDIDVLAIDNGWLSLFWETGLFGLILVLIAVIATVVAVFKAPTPYIRASAGFLVTYVVIASFTESGLSDLSSYSLHILVAAGASYADRVSVRGAWPMLPRLARSKVPIG
jgi:O-antigen ligase